MRHTILFAALAVLLSAGSAPAQTYSFLLDDQIAVADLAGGAPRKLAEGADPAISPDGTQIAYTQFDKKGNRRIAILDVASGRSRLVEGIEGKNEFMPAWSADGRQLLLSHFTGADWALAAVRAEGGGFQIVIDPGTRSAAGYCALPGGTDWLCHDLEGFYTVSLSADGPGTIRESAKVGRIEGLSMPSRLAVSPDGKTALFSRFVDDEGSSEPPSAVYLLDLATGETTRMTPPGVLADGPAWLPGGQEFLFTSFDPKTETPSIYRTSIRPGSKPALVKANASNPSAAGP